MFVFVFFSQRKGALMIRSYRPVSLIQRMIKYPLLETKEKTWGLHLISLCGRPYLLKF